MSSGPAWSRWEDLLVRRLFLDWEPERISFLLGIRTAKAVKSRAKVLGLRKGGRHYWTAEEDALLRQFYPHESSLEIAQRCAHSLASTYRRATFLGLKKTREYLEAQHIEEGRRLTVAGRTHRFQKGHVQNNKGIRRPGWSAGRMRETQFKKGQLNGRARQIVLPVGTVKFNSDGYLIRKIDDKPNNGVGARTQIGNLWENEFGEMPTVDPQRSPHLGGKAETTKIAGSKTSKLSPMPSTWLVPQSTIFP